ncbi:Ig-like domain-containing protein, partial [bacterium]|nr:Ig-like domain-containing protein [bacterium]
EYKENPNLQRKKKLERPESLREGVKFSSHAKLPRTVDRAPRFTVSFPNLTTRTEDGIPILKGKTLVQVALNEADIHHMIQFRYEIAFYVDYQLYAEQEEGVSPFNWVWDPTGIPPGEHILTVNIVSLMNQFGIKNLKFIVEE